MVELQILNKVLKEGNLSLIVSNGLSADYFINYKEEFEYILNHYNRYGNVPDKETFLSKFQDFSLIDVTESDRYLIETISEEYLYYKSVPVVNKIAELLKTNANSAVEYMLSKIPELSSSRLIEGVDLVKDARLRFQAYKDRSTKPETSVIRTGFAELDEILFGWEMGEELVTIVGRTNQGKSWLLLEFLKSAWKQNKRVGLYSGEMSANKIGFRFDSLMNHFSNTNLVRGIDEPEYEDFINWLSSRENPFIVVTQKELGGRATVSKINSLIEKYELDIFGIDQYSLMADERCSKGDPLRLQLAHITEDLFKTSTRYRIPILGLAQANRSGAKYKDEEGTPELEHVKESDDITHNSSRVLSMRQTGAGLELSVKKNREGRVGDTLTYFWDIDRGQFKYIPVHGDAVRGQKVEQVKKEFKDGADAF